MDELKPCPFCGNKDIAWTITTSYADIRCRKCKAAIVRGLAMGKFDCLKDSEEALKPVVVKAWNTRAKEVQQ